MSTKSVFAADIVYHQLFRLREKLTPDGTWVKYTHAKNIFGDSVQAKAKDATCWCIAGARDAVIRAENGIGCTSPLGKFLTARAVDYNRFDIPELNDEMCQTQTDVLLFLDWCIAVREWQLETRVTEPTA